MEKAKRKLGLVMLTALVSGNMLGSGVFLLPASLAQIGSITLLSWGLTAFGALMLALLFARLSVLVPQAGGPYVFAQEGFGRFIGFQTAYSYWVALWVGNAAIALAAVGYAQAFFPWLQTPFHACLAAVALVWIFTGFNVLGARVAGTVQVVTFVGKVLPLALVIVGGVAYLHPDYLTQNFNVSGQSNWQALSRGAALTLWAFVGVESATVSAERSLNPRRDVPLATILGTVIAALIYVLSSTIIMAMVPAAQLANSTSPFSLAAAIMFGQTGHVLVTLGAIVSCLGALNGWILLQGQVAMNAARDHYFPQIFSKQNRQKVPMQALVITSLLITVLLFLTASPSLINQFNFIILLANLTILIPYFYSAIAYFMVRRREKGRFSKRGIVMGSVAALYSYWVIMGSGPEIVYWGLLFLLTSFPLYSLLHRRH